MHDNFVNFVDEFIKKQREEMIILKIKLDLAEIEIKAAKKVIQKSIDGLSKLEQNQVVL